MHSPSGEERVIAERTVLPLRGAESLANLLPARELTEPLELAQRDHLRFGGTPFGGGARCGATRLVLVRADLGCPVAEIPDVQSTAVFVLREEHRCVRMNRQKRDPLQTKIERSWLEDGERLPVRRSPNQHLSVARL